MSILPQAQTTTVMPTSARRMMDFAHAVGINVPVHLILWLRMQLPRIFLPQVFQTFAGRFLRTVNRV